jgi:phenylpropionate dioxygenase-like ring-hydroxylating dioxygenase large terminal subunit
VLISDAPALRSYWYPIAYSEQVGAEPRPFRIFGADYVAWRVTAGGPVLAAADACPHRSARLSQGWVSDGCLVCPYHGWRFATDGSCVEIPANDPGLPIPPRARLASVAAGERYGLVWVCVGEPRTGIPVLAEAEDPEFTVVHEMMEVWEASATRILDNALDMAHVAWVHRATVGDPSSPRLGPLTVERDGSSLRYRSSHVARVGAQLRANTGIMTDTTTRASEVELVNPLVFRGVLEYVDNGLIHVLLKTATPLDDRSTLFCQFVARNDAPDQVKQAGIIAVDRAVQAEDRAMLEGIDPDFPIDVTTEVHTRSDRMTVEYRRILADLAAEGEAH